MQNPSLDYKALKNLIDMIRLKLAIATEVNAIADLVDQQFPDTEIEIIDYGTQPRSSQRTQRKNASRTLSTRQ